MHFDIIVAKHFGLFNMIWWRSHIVFQEPVKILFHILKKKNDFETIF